MSLALAILLGASSLAPTERVGKPLPQVDRMAGNPSPLNKYSKADTQKVHELFGECVVKRHPKQAEAFLLQPDFDDESLGKALAKMDLGDCLVDVSMDGFYDLKMKLPGDLLRYALAGPLVRRAFGLVPISEFKSVPPLKHQTYDEAEYSKLAKSETAEEIEKLKMTRRGAIFLSAFGECVVRTDPVNSFGLVVSESGGVEDKTRMAALLPTLGACLPAGKQLSFERFQIRGTIANNYFRLASAARAIGATPGATR